MCLRAVDRVGGRATHRTTARGFLMETEKATGRQAVDYGDQVAGPHNVRGDLVGAVAEALDEHSAAGFISRCARLRFWPRQASIVVRAGAAGRAVTGPAPACPAHPAPSKPEQRA
jgi:hypothetical protein